MMSEIGPEPESDRTLTATIVAEVATPNLAPTAVPAVCVPWLGQSIDKHLVGQGTKLTPTRFHQRQRSHRMSPPGGTTSKA